MHVKYCTIILMKLLKSKKWREDMKRKEEKDVVLDEVIKELSWKERIVVRIFNKIFSKISNLIRIAIINFYLK